jgi:hypothetical protein
MDKGVSPSEKNNIDLTHRSLEAVNTGGQQCSCTDRAGAYQCQNQHVSKVLRRDEQRQKQKGICTGLLKSASSMGQKRGQ